MNWNRLLLASSIICLSCVTPAHGQLSKSDRDALARLRSQADKGDAEAQLKLGSMYASGIGLEQDYKKAAKWHRKAAEQGLAAAEYQLGLDYADGKGVKPDEREALKWYRGAAEQGLVDAQIELGRAYANGRGVRTSALEAISWFRKAAEQGSAAGKYELARSYLDGVGTTKDLVEAMKWLRPAAEQGNASAQYRLGQCYERGEGVTKDLVQAYKWYDLAAAHDEDDAADIRLSLAKVETLLSTDQIAQAQELARDFKERSSTAASSSAPADASAMGSLSVTCADERSDLMVDGAFVGNPPAKLRLAAGQHVVEVKRTGFKPYRRELKISPDAQLTLRVELEKE